MRYRVTVRKRDGNWPGRHRSGRFFPKDQETILTAEEMTDAILADPILIVEELANEEPEQPETPADPPHAEHRCSELTAKGEPCRGRPLPESDLCLAHAKARSK